MIGVNDYSLLLSLWVGFPRDTESLFFDETWRLLLSEKSKEN